LFFNLNCFALRNTYFGSNCSFASTADDKTILINKKRSNIKLLNDADAMETRQIQGIIKRRILNINDD